MPGARRTLQVRRMLLVGKMAGAAELGNPGQIFVS
jgi:hypothetical protein